MTKTRVSKSLSELTVQNCMELYQKEGYRAICNDGQLDGFVKDSDQAEKLEFIWLNNKALN